MILSLKQYTYIFILGLFCLSSCSREVACEAFDYQNFGIDTVELKKDQFLVSGNDTLVLKIRRWVKIDLKKNIESFVKVAECNNGVTIDLECDELDLFFTYGFILNKKGYSYWIVSPYFDMKDISVKKSTDINLTIDRFEHNNKTPCTKLIEIKNGKIFKILDSSNRVWTPGPQNL
jgi:hypothetical protein